MNNSFRKKMSEKKVRAIKPGDAPFSYICVDLSTLMAKFCFLRFLLELTLQI